VRPPVQLRISDDVLQFFQPMATITTIDDTPLRLTLEGFNVATTSHEETHARLA